MEQVGTEAQGAKTRRTNNSVSRTWTRVDQTFWSKVGMEDLRIDCASLIMTRTILATQDNDKLDKHIPEKEKLRTPHRPAAVV